MFHFQHIEYLTALVLVPLMIVSYFIVLRFKKKTLLKIGDAALVNQLIKDYSPSKFSIKFILIVVAFVIGVIALANPRKPQGSSIVNRSGIDVMIALDVSKSMLAEDIKPSRLERAKQFISKLIDRLPNDRIGIVVFAGRAYLQMPLTTDHAAAKMYLSSATTDVVPTQGTVIGDALKMCYAAFNTQEKKYKAVVLISDGEDHDESAIKITKSLADEGVMVNTIGIGSPEGTTIIDPATNETKKDATGAPIITKLNEEELRSIATNGNGLYQLFTTTDEVVDNMVTQLKTIGQHSISESSLLDYKDYFPWLLGVVLIILLIEFFMSEIKPIVKNTKKNIKKPVVVVVLFLIPTLLFAQNNNALIKQGNDAYYKKEYDVAADDYKKAADKDPENEKAQYNLGNALYKKGKTEEALSAYDAAIKAGKTKNNQSDSWFNKGVALQNNKKLPECIDAYKNSLRLNPADEDARFNLQKALQQQQKQQQQKDKDDKDKKKPESNPKQKKDDKKQDEKDNGQQPKPQPSKMTQKEAEEKLKALLQHEKNLQDRLRKVDAASPEKPEKDW